MKYKFSNFFIFLLILFIFQLPSYAEKKQKEKIKQSKLPLILEEIVVRGEVVSETATVTMVTASEIRESGAKTIAQVLEFIPGTHVRVGAKGESYIRMRGFRQREVALLIDGVPVSSPYHGQLDLNSLPAEAIERIDVVKGASSVMYGANAMGGVINIITKKSAGVTALSFKGDLGSGESMNFGASASGTIGKLQYMLSGSYLKQEYYSMSDNYDIRANQPILDRANSDRRLWNGRVNFGLDLGRKNHLAFTFNHNDQVRGLPHHESDKKAKFNRLNDWQQGIMDIIYTFHMRKGSLKVKFYMDYINSVLDSYDDVNYSTQTGRNAYTEIMENNALGGDIYFKHQLNPQFLFKSAFRLRRDNNKLQMDIDEEWENNHLNTYSLPVEMEWRPVPFLDLTAGTSLDLMVFEKGHDSGTRTSTAINPQVAVILKPVKKIRFKLSFAHKTRFPTMRELFSPITGNTELNPMEAMIYEAGLQFSPSAGYDFSITGFYNSVEGLISKAGKNDPYQNIDKALLSGFELGARFNSLSFLGLHLFYTYLYAEDLSSDTPGSIEYRPKHKVDANMLVKLPAQIRLNAHLSYVSKQIFYDGGEQSLDPYTLLNLRLSKRIGKVVEIHMQVNNVFDINYYESDGYPREGRMIYGGIQIDLN